MTETSETERSPSLPGVQTTRHRSQIDICAPYRPAAAAKVRDWRALSLRNRDFRSVRQDRAESRTGIVSTAREVGSVVVTPSVDRLASTERFLPADAGVYEVSREEIS